VGVEKVPKGGSSCRELITSRETVTVRGELVALEAETVTKPVWEPVPSPLTETETVTTPEPEPEDGEQESHAAEGDAVQCKVPPPLLSINRVCPPVTVPPVTPPKLKLVRFNEIFGDAADTMENTALLVSEGLPSEASLTFTRHFEEVVEGSFQE